MKREESFRIEEDTIGKVKVPIGVYWGVQTQRAIENFPVSGMVFPREFIFAIGLIKMAAAKANISLGKLKKKIGDAIVQAAGEVMNGKFDDQFVVDIFQTGSGTSTNMNANEVIANRAIELQGGKRGSKHPVHPNNHVNMGQSSNDVIPSCVHISAAQMIKNELIPELFKLKRELKKKAKIFDPIVKLGRTHLQDATPVRLGQEFSGYETMIGHNIDRLKGTLDHLMELAVGGTAVGTGINRDPKFPEIVIKEINNRTGENFMEAENHFEAQGSRDAIVQASSTIKTLAVSLTKIANDIRWMGSGPYGLIGELIIPEVQPGSSIMPGKVNPVIIESLLQVNAQVIGNDITITVGGQSGNFELNVMMPVMATNLFQSIQLLTNIIHIFTEKCIRGLIADKKRCKHLLEKSLAMLTSLTPIIGYDATADIAKEAYSTGKNLKTVLLEKKILSEKEIEAILDPRLMTEPKP